MYGDEGSAHHNHYSSNTFHPPHPHPQLNQRQQSSGRLTRFNSAPNSFFQTLLDDDCSFLPPRSNEILSARQPLQSFTHQDQEQHNIIKHETVMEQFDNNMYNDGFASLRNIIHSSSSSSGGGALLRQSSSPADFFSSVFDDNVAFASYRGNSQAPHHIQSNHHPMPSIPEFQQHHIVSGSLGESYADCWLGKRRSGDLGNEIETVSNELGHQNGYSVDASNGLIHQMSLPNTSSEFAAVNKYLQFQGSSTSTPCSSTRAKRGFATHPRSIAERVRRTKISDRMRKLQQLFPEIDKQTNTAQMLDMATDYIKDLEKEVKSLTDTHSKCKCLRQ